MKELLKELKRVSRKASILEQDNFKLIAKQEELTEMIEALIDELEGTTKTDHTFRLVREAKDLIYY